MTIKPSKPYDAQSAVERELVLRLANLLWRLRRATAIDTGPFEIQASHLSEFRQARQLHSAATEVVYALFRRADPIGFDHDTRAAPASPSAGSKSVERSIDRTVEFARCFLRLANLPNYPLDRVSQPIRGSTVALSRPDPVCAQCPRSPQTTGEGSSIQR